MPTLTFGDNTTNNHSGTDDARVRTTAPTVNYGSETAGYVSKYSAGNWEYAFWRFTGLSNIPAGSTITAVSLHVYCSAQLGSVSHTATFREVKRAWVEAQITCNIFSTGNSWQTSGGIGNDDRDNTASLGTMTLNTTTGEYKVLTGNANFVALVQAWLDGTKTNNGIQYERTDAENDSSAKQLVWSEGTNGQRPYLTVEYTEGGGSSVTPLSWQGSYPDQILQEDEIIDY